MAEPTAGGGADGRGHRKANGVGATLVGGSRKQHGGPDLGPTRARARLAAACTFDGTGLADAPPGSRTDPTPICIPRLTLRNGRRHPGLPARTGMFAGRKTAAYRQIGNAFPPPVARAVGISIRSAIETARARLVAEPERLLRAV